MMNHAREISVLMSDRRWGFAEGDSSISVKLGLPANHKSLWFLGLSMKPYSQHETCGLALVKHDNGHFKRAGLFMVGIEHITRSPSLEQQ